MNAPHAPHVPAPARQQVRIFGIRHHGPGSARSLLAALEVMKPDAILIEGPPEGNAALPYCISPEMQPPVALLVYPPEHMEQAGYFPLAVFSPEWQALRFGLETGAAVRFIDMPMAHRLAMHSETAPQTEPPSIEEQVMAFLARGVQREPEIHEDPMYWLARAAGYNDGERWWEHLVEQRRDSADPFNVFEAILAAMTALRDATDKSPDMLGPYREAFMRRALRAAKVEGFARIAVVCGAWHAPALARMSSRRHDAALMEKLPRLEVAVSWVPWTYGRLMRGGGYGAGVHSPGWFHHLWASREDIAIGWLSQIARGLRGQDLDASPAQIIDAVRLAETLAALRDRPLPGLPELSEAALAVFCGGNHEPLRIVYDKLMIGERMGKVPDIVPKLPLQRDLIAQQARLELTAGPEQTALDLDLRTPRDLERSHLLHRLRLLGLPWGNPQQNPNSPFAPRQSGPPRPGGGSLLRRINRGSNTPDEPEAGGTYQERWQMRWQPEFVVRLIELSHWGNTVRDAAAAFTRETILHTQDLAQLTRHIDLTLLADLPEIIDPLMARLQERAALTSDVAALMEAIPPMVRLLRYGNVRHTDEALLAGILRDLTLRVCVNLPNACVFINADAAQELYRRLNAVNYVIFALEATNPAITDGWRAMLNTLAARRDVNPLIQGRAARILFDSGSRSLEWTRGEMAFSLSRAGDPGLGAAWLEGFIRGGALTLLHDEDLWRALSAWIGGLPGEIFQALLPVLRRTFSTFSQPERRKLGERARRGVALETRAGVSIDPTRGDQVLPVLLRLLGAQPEPQPEPQFVPKGAAS